MPDAHLTAVNGAVRLNHLLAKLFGQLGTEEHPRGRVLTAYRQARKAIAKALDDPASVLEILQNLREQVRAAGNEALAKAVGEAIEEARKAVVAYRLPRVRAEGGPQIVAQALDAWTASVDQQIAAVEAMARSGIADAGLVVGDETRMGLLSPAPVIRDAAQWMTMVAAAAYDGFIRQSTEVATQTERYLRQAVATIDHKTTDCCLRVHGQVQPIGSPFLLRGTPRFADEVQQPPFHWWCRTSLALVLQSEADDKLTRQMRDAADAELKARQKAIEQQRELEAQLAKKGAAPDIRVRKGDSTEIKVLREKLRYWRGQERVEIWPSNARSGRR